MSERNLLSKRVEGLSIIAKQKVSSFLSGNRRSLFLGTGTEFADLREYVFGDDQRYTSDIRHAPTSNTRLRDDIFLACPLPGFDQRLERLVP